MSVKNTSPKILHCVVYHDVEQRIVALEDAAALPTAGKLDAHALFEVLGQVEDRFFFAFLRL